MVGADRYREMRGRRAGQEYRAKPSPGLPESGRIGHQTGAEFIAVGRQVIQQDGPPVGRMPAIEIALLPRLPAEPRQSTP